MRHLGRYRLVERLGAGAFATVWLAHDDGLDIRVAIKVLADNWSSNADIRERFLAEARLLRRIDDPRVVRVHDIGATTVEGRADGDDQPYFVMDYVAGGTLADVVAHPLPPQEAIELAVQTAYAVQVLHDHDVVHRDVKPSNLLLGRHAGRPRVLVTDLGMAKSLAEASGLTVTAGTPAYMAPEQVQGGDGFDARADVYAVAAVTHSLLTGRPPFAVQSLQDVVARDPAVAPRPVAAGLGLPAAVDTLLAAALAKDPDLRPSSAREFAERLVAAVEPDPAWSDTLLDLAPVPTSRPPAQATVLLASAPPVSPNELDGGSELDGAKDLDRPSGRNDPTDGALAAPSRRTWSAPLVAVWSAAAFLALFVATYAVLTLR